MRWDDLRAEIVITTPDGFRLAPLQFTMPQGRAMQALEDELRRSYRIKELELQTRIGTLEAEIEILRRPKKAAWWQRRPKRKSDEG